MIAMNLAWAEPATVRQWGDYWARFYGLEPELVHAVIEAESAGNARAVSSAGAAGVMQLMPDTAVTYRVTNRFDVRENVRAGVAYLAWLQDQCGGDKRLMIAAYIAGERRVRRDGLFALYSREIHDYVTRVAYLYRRNRWEALLREEVKPR
ncbi:MAG: lytic transglycosylase domain-containing protein [Bryobacterales bacterium]|nr:lytic transglycosylase domain-containing protein [Bryobacterales bacterium]